MSTGKLIKGKFVRALTCKQDGIEAFSAPAWGEIVWDCDHPFDDSDVTFFFFEHPEDRDLFGDEDNPGKGVMFDSDDTFRVYSFETLPSKVLAAFTAWRLTQ